MNPKLDIVATDNIKTNVTEGSGSRLVNFLVTLMAGGNLNAPKISFDMSTEDDASIKNELQSMSADQRQTTAMNLVLTGHYTGSGTKMGTPVSAQVCCMVIWHPPSTTGRRRIFAA